MSVEPTVEEFRKVCNLHLTEPKDERLQPHLDFGEREARKILGAALYAEIKAKDTVSEADAADLLLAIYLLALCGALPFLNLKTRGDGITLSQAERAEGLAGTTSYMTPAQMKDFKKQISDEAKSLLEAWIPPASPKVFKAGCAPD